MQKLLIILLGLVFVTGCSSFSHQEVTKDEVVVIAKKAVAKRENWANDGYYITEQDKYDHGWRVSASKLDRTQMWYPPIQTYEILISRYGKVVMCYEMK